MKKIILSHGLKYCFDVNDSPIYITFGFDDTPEAISKIEFCMSDVRNWMAKHFL